MHLPLKKISRFLFVGFILTSLFLFSCNTKKQENLLAKTNSEGVAKIKFDTTYYDFGTLIQGEKAAYTFKFKNIGTGDLMILDAFSTCGCTIPNYNKEPISPGGEGKIDVVFDSKGKRGLQYKTISLKLNTLNKEKSITIKANVILK